MSEALEGLRVIDMGHVLAAPFCASLLADFGAEVIKIEPPIVGDGVRQMGRIKNLNFAVENRNKKCVTLNLKDEEGKRILKKLVKVSDIIIQNYRPGTLEKLGFGYDELRKINNKIILVSISGYGQDGPYKHKPGYDSVGLALGGLSYATGFPDGPPVRPGYAIADYATGLFAAYGALVAVYNRDVMGTNEGQIVDATLFESVFRMTECTTSEYAYDGYIKQRIGNGHAATVPSGHFMTKDNKWVTITGGNDKVFAGFAKAIGREDLLEDSTLKTQMDRLKRKDYIENLAKEFILKYTLTEVLEIFESAIPASPIYSIEDIFKDPHYAAREAIVDVDSKEFGKVKMQNAFPKLSETPGKIKWAGQKLGFCNDEVYGNLLGLTEEEIEKLLENGTI